ncbi:MAG: LacI family DNA-binding transcriptional regulator [Lachnospiraceae bacterium]|nr:LacI family DNA-binding transcriptional regulator [Candidatus Colinaster equi]
MVKLSDIAKAAGVSTSTVSNVLNGKTNVSSDTKNRILALCQEMHYEPNYIGKTLKQGSNRTVLFVFSDFDRHFYLKIIQGISDYVYSKGYDLLICTNRNCEKYMNKSTTCGCIMLDVHSSDKTIIQKASKDYPIVVLDRIINEPYIKSMLVNNYTPQAEMVEGLIRKGCKRFAFLSGIDTLDTRERYKALTDTLAAHDLTLRREDYYTGDFREKSGYQAARLIMLKENLPDVLVCANDDMAIGAIRAFRENGLRIPDALSIVGFDDNELAKAMGLTTIQIPNYERGYIAAQYLIEGLEGIGDYSEFKISANIKWRKTTVQ